MPYELLNRRFRAAQKSVDRELNQVTQACSEAAGLLAEPELSVDDAVGVLDSVEFKVSTMNGKVCVLVCVCGAIVTTLVEKVAECLEEEGECSQLCRVRLEHLKSYATEEQTDGMKTAWRQVRVDRMLVDHFLRAGHYTAAYKLCVSSGIGVSRRKL